jgi:hypothetical protein
MPNFNDAEITSLYVSEEGAVHDIQDDAPNAPGGGPFRVTLEMVAGGGVAGKYHLITTCSDLTDTKEAPALNPGTPLNGIGDFGGAGWQPNGAPLTHSVFNKSMKVAAPKDKGHVYRYTAALRHDNGQIVSIRQSDPFILL